MLTKLYIGQNSIDIQEKVNLQYFLSDWKSFNSGSNTNSFTFRIPLNRKNAWILKNPQIPGSTEFVTGVSSLFVSGIQMLKGKLVVLSSTRDEAEVLIEGKEWSENLSQLKLTDLDLSSEDYTLTASNVESSWSGADKFYRYPMINMGALAMGGLFVNADWSPIDFMPWFRIKNIVAKIFEKYTVVSDFFDSTFGKNLYMSAKRYTCNQDFLQDKKFDANITSSTDNWAQVVIPNMSVDSAIVDCSTYANRTQINTEITDDGGNWATDAYTVPVTGTYRFRMSFKAEISWGGSYPLMVGRINFRIMRRRSSVDTAVAVFTDDTVTLLADWNSVHDLDTDYIHCLAGDIIWVYTYLQAVDQNTTGGPLTLTVFLTGGASYHFWNEVDNWCLYEGLGKTIAISDNLPDMSQLEFLQGLKHAFNLRFFFDTLQKKLYVDPADLFMSTNEYNLTPYVNGEAKLTNFITEQAKTLWLRWKDDSEDQLHKDYTSEHPTPPYYKAIAFTNTYMKDELEISPNPVFSVCLMTEYRIAFGCPSIESMYALFDRTLANTCPSSPIRSYVPRIGEWKGLVSGLSWLYQGTSKTTYPQMAPIDLSAMYTSYFLKTIHYMNTGKMAECQIRATPQFINSLITEMGSLLILGWKVKYKLNVNGTNYLFYLSRVVTDGETANLELILAQ